jgi:hypothetical protein
MKQWRYHDVERQLDDELLAEAAKVAGPSADEVLASQPDDLDGGALQRIIEGDTACRDVDDIKAAADAAAPLLLKEHAEKVAQKQDIASKGAALNALISSWTK